MRVIAQENTDRILLQPDVFFQLGNLGIRYIEYLLGLQHIKPCGYSVVESQLGELDRLFLVLNCSSRNLELQIELKELELVTR